MQILRSKISADAFAGGYSLPLTRCQRQLSRLSSDAYTRTSVSNRTLTSVMPVHFTSDTLPPFSDRAWTMPDIPRERHRGSYRTLRKCWMHDDSFFFFFLQTNRGNGVKLRLTRYIVSRNREIRGPTEARSLCGTKIVFSPALIAHKSTQTWY